MVLLPRVNRQTIETVQTLKVRKNIGFENQLLSSSRTMIPHIMGSYPPMTSESSNYNQSNNNSVSIIQDNNFGSLSSSKHFIPNYCYLSPSGEMLQTGKFTKNDLVRKPLASAALNLHKQNLFVKARNTLNSSKKMKRREHNEMKGFHCENCQKYFSVAADLQRHIRKNHIGARSHVCPECGKTFTTSSGCKQHQNVHRTYKPFSCDVCHRSYTQFSNLCRHRRMREECRKKVQCQKCRQMVRGSNLPGKLCEFCKTDKQASNKKNLTQIKNQRKESTIISNRNSQTVNSIPTHDANSNVLVQDDTFKELQRLCSSVSHTNDSLLLRKNNSTLPLRKRLWESAFNGELGISGPGYKKQPKKFCDVQVQCNVETGNTAFSRKKNSSHVRKMLGLSSAFLSDRSYSNKSNNLVRPKTSLKHAPDCVTENLISSSPQSAAERSSSLFSNKTFRNSQPNITAAASIAEDCLRYSSLEKKAESVFVANEKIRWFGFPKPQSCKKITSEKIIENMEEKTKEKPLDLSLRRKASPNTKQTPENKQIPFQNELRIPLNQYLFYKVGQHYGRTVLPSYQEETKTHCNSFKIPSAFDSPETLNWPNSLSRFYQPYNYSLFPTDFNDKSTSPISKVDKPSNKQLPSHNDRTRQATHNQPTRFHPTTEVTTEDQPNFCLLCKKVYSDFITFQRHLKLAHNQKIASSLSICQQFWDKQKHPLQLMRNNSFGNFESKQSYLDIENRSHRCDAMQSSPPHHDDDNNQQTPRRKSSSSSLESRNVSTPFRPWTNSYDTESSSPIGSDSRREGSPISYCPSSLNDSAVKCATDGPVHLSNFRFMQNSRVLKV